MGRRLLALCGCAALLAGCGGGGDATGTNHTSSGGIYLLDGTASCLEKEAFTISTKEKDVGFIAFSAPAGGLRAKKKGADVIIAFGNNARDRRRLLKGVKQFARHSAIFRYRYGLQNVVVLWAYRPAKAKEKVVAACLRESAQ
jgi:hypothetical protein